MWIFATEKQHSITSFASWTDRSFLPVTDIYRLSLQRIVVRVFVGQQRWMARQVFSPVDGWSDDLWMKTQSHCQLFDLRFTSTDCSDSCNGTLWGLAFTPRSMTLKNGRMLRTVADWQRRENGVAYTWFSVTACSMIKIHMYDYTIYPPLRPLANIKYRPESSHSIRSRNPVTANSRTAAAL